MEHQSTSLRSYLTDFSILFNMGHVEWVELADVVPISGLVLHNDGLLIVLLVIVLLVEMSTKSKYMQL